MFNDKFGLTEAVLIGRKTMTRRRVIEGSLVPKYKVGEVVAIAQCYKEIIKSKQYGSIWAVGNDITVDDAGYTNKMFVKADLMPHQIKITNIRVEQLQDISDEDSLREGIEVTQSNRGRYLEKVNQANGGCITYQLGEATPIEAFAKLIDKVSGKGTWGNNPYVLVYEYELIK